MSDVTLVEVADAIVSALNLPAAPRAPATWCRALDTDVELEDLEVLHAQVFPGSLKTEAGARNGEYQRGEYAIDVVLRQKLDTDDRQKVDGLFRLLRKVDKYLFGLQRLPVMPDAAWLASSMRYPYVPAKFKAREYWALLSVTYLVFD
jgi:hypothetical protein